MRKVRKSLDRKDVGILAYDDYVGVGMKRFSIGYVEGRVHFSKLLFCREYLCDWFVYEFEDFNDGQSFCEVSFRDVPFNMDLSDVALDEEQSYIDILGKLFRERYDIHSAPLLRLACVNDDLSPLLGTHLKRFYDIKKYIPY